MGLSPAAILYDAAGNALKVIADGSDYLLSIASKLRNVAGTIVNPSTEDTLATRASETTLAAIKSTDGVKKIVDPLPAGTNNIGDVDVLSSALPTGAATETTLAAVKAKTDSIPADPAREGGKLTSLETILTAIRDTAGVKKITDALPAGASEIGKVAQGTKAAGSAAWPQVLYDASGNAVGVVLDGALYRLQAEAKIAKGASALLHLDAIDTTSGKGRLKTTLYTSEGDPVAFGSVPPNPSSIKNAFVLNGGSDSLLVNGSVTPVAFTYEADATHDIAVQELRFTLASNSITFGSAYFGATAGPLPNGVLIEIIAGGETGAIATLVQNESIVNFASPGGFVWVVSSKDLVSSDLVIGGAFKLIHGTADKVRVTIRDNLSSAGVYFKCFVKGNLLG